MTETESLVQAPSNSTLISDLQRRAVKDLPPDSSLVEEAPGFGKRIAQRFLGTDVDDPLEIPRLGSTLIGGLAGGILGSRVPTAPGAAGLFINPITGAVGGGLAGTVAGAISPETAIELGERAGIVEPGTRDRIGLSPSELRTLAEGEALLDLATAGGFTALRLTGRGTAKLLTGVTAEGQEIAEKAARQNIALMPVQVGDRPIGRGYVAVMGRFPFIGSSIRKRGQATEIQLKAAIEGIPERIGPVGSWSDVSEEIFKNARDLVTKTNKHFNHKYTALWKEADALGTQVVPKETVSKANEILATIAKRTPQTLEGPGSPGAAVQKVKDFLEREILPMGKDMESGAVYARQGFEQMDGLVSKIDQEIATLEPSQKRFALSLFTDLRQAAQKDALINVRGPGSDVVAAEMKALDEEFSHTLSSLFETSTAKKFGSVRRRGIRGVTADEATRTPVDQLARIVTKIDSPQAIDELSRLVTPETFQRITANVLDDGITESMTTVGGVGKTLDADKFSKFLGVDKPTSPRREVISTMLEKSGSPLKITDLDDLATVARTVADLEIPNASMFIARRASISGIQGVINGIIPGLALASAPTGAGAAAGFFGGGFVGIATFLGGGKLISAIISNPTSARALKTVLDKEATSLVKRQAMADALRLGLAEMSADGSITREMYDKLNELVFYTLDAFDREMEALGHKIQ